MKINPKYFKVIALVLLACDPSESIIIYNQKANCRLYIALFGNRPEQHFVSGFQCCDIQQQIHENINANQDLLTNAPSLIDYTIVDYNHVSKTIELQTVKYIIDSFIAIQQLKPSNYKIQPSGITNSSVGLAIHLPVDKFELDRFRQFELDIQIRYSQ